MKEQDDRLTLRETEELCRMYMDCHLSVFEETELRYLLGRVDYHSPLIDEVRRIMDIEMLIVHEPVVEAYNPRPGLLRKWRAAIGVAASVALAFGIGMFFFQSQSGGEGSDESFYLAYVDGRRLSDDEARKQIDAEKKSVDDFIREMSELEAREQQMIDNFFNL